MNPANMTPEEMQNAQDQMDHLMGKAKKESPIEKFAKELKEKAWKLQSLFTKVGRELPWDKKWKSEHYRFGSRVISIMSDISYTCPKDLVERGKELDKELDERIKNVQETVKRLEAEVEQERGKIKQRQEDGTYKKVEKTVEGRAREETQEALQFNRWTAGGGLPDRLLSLRGEDKLPLHSIGMGDGDLAIVIHHLAQCPDVTELDLRQNRLGDAGVQQLVASIGAGTAPKLEKLLLGGNQLGTSTTVMLEEGLKYIRPNLKVDLDAGDVPPPPAMPEPKSARPSGELDTHEVVANTSDEFEIVDHVASAVQEVSLDARIEEVDEMD